MKGKKLFIISIIINILSIGIIYNFIKKDYISNKKIIVKTMTGTEYENNITSLNKTHEKYANYIEESKKKIASAITDMGVTTSNEETLEIMANNIKNIPVNNFTRFYSATVPITTTPHTYEIGFRPKFLMLGLTDNNAVFWYDETLNKYVYNAHLSEAVSLGSWDKWNLCNIIEITDTGFIAQTGYSMTGFLIAFG